MSIPIDPNSTTSTPELFGAASDDNDDPLSMTSTKVLDDDESGQEDEVEEDNLESEQRPRSRSDSSDSHFVLEKTRRNSGFGSKDPLFQAVYLHDGSMTTEQIKTYKSRFGIDKAHKNNSNNNGNNRNQSQSENGVFWRSPFLNFFFSSSQ